MKLTTVRSDVAFHTGVLIGDEVLDLVAARAAISFASLVPASMTALLAAGADGLDVVARVIALAHEPHTLAQLRAEGALRPFATAALGPVVPEPEMVLSGSMNSHGHLREMGDTPPPYPCAFHKVRSALTGSGTDIVPPPGASDMIDWEGEFSLVIGKRCHRVTGDDALDYVVGYTLMNDVSARDYARPFITATGASPTAQAWERNVLGKNYPTFAPIGPVIATRDEFPTPFAYHMETLVNGEVMQSSTEHDLVFGPAEMIAYFSQFYIFQPGDIVSMGSPPGVGMARKPQLFLKPGDTVIVRERSIGELVNHIAKG